MAIAGSVSIAVLVCVVLFYKEVKKTDLSPLIFLLILVLIGVMYGSSPDSFSTHLAKGPGNMLKLGAALLLLIAFRGTDTFQVLKNMPASAYKALAPAAISVGVIVLLALIAIL